MDQNINNVGGSIAMHKNKWKLIGIIALIIAIIGFVVIYTQISKANADYICTYIVEENDPCGNGNWNSWATVSTTGDSEQCTQRVEERRVYTGTRETRHILQYLTLRTSCDSAYSQARYGDGGGSSGFHGGSIVSETAVCQIEEIRVTQDSPSCSVESDTNDTEVTTTATQIDTDIDTQSTDISAIDQLTQFRESKIDGRITADPEQLRSGTPTTIQWRGVEMASCAVTGSNGDSWTGTSGEKLSSAIESITTFTLDCIAFNGDQVQESVEVTIIPEFQEI